MKKLRHAPYSIFIVFSVFIFSLIIINSCKKDIKTSASANINNPAMVSRAKQWYESTYPVKPVALQGTHQTYSINDTTGGLSRFAHPDWQDNNVYLRYTDSVIEMPIDPSDKIKTALGNGIAGYNYDINYTRSSFILLKNGSNYSAYVMTIIADSAYLKNDLGKLALNTYRKRDTAFSGLVLYFTPKGNFVSGFKYSKGHLVIPAAQNSNSTQVQAIKHKAASTPRIDVAAPAGNCEDWYFVIYSIATLDIVYSQYEYTICDPAPSTDGGGAAPAPPPPCKLPTTLPDNIGRAPVIFGNAPPSSGPTTGPGDGNGGGDDDGGMPPPTTDMCPTIVVVDTLLKTNHLTLAQQDSLQAVLATILQNCLGQALNTYLTKNLMSFPFIYNPNSINPASYNPQTNNITVNNISTLTPEALQEEFFHAYQNKTMPGGTAKYAGKAGSANIEFEAKVLRDMSLYMNLINGNGAPGISTITDPNYYDWLSSITNDFTQYPTSFTPTQLTQYFNFMPEFLQQNPGYSADIISPTLNPLAIFNLINSSPCAH